MIESSAGTRPLTVSRRKATEVSVSRFALVVVEGAQKGLVVMLDSPSVCVGAAPANDLVLTDDAVSRHHAIFTTTADGIRIEDQGSSNGTWLGADRITQAVLPHGGTVRLGTTVIHVRPEKGRFVVFPDTEPQFAGMVGGSPVMAEIFALVRQLARTDLPVLVTGETGTGKELIGRALHDAGNRSARPFLVLDCAAIMPDLLRSELFGHEKGSFTGADKTTKGVLEEAAGGTVFLDEIGELDLSIQPHLLRALETRSISRIGSRQSLSVDFRIVAATNRDLKKSAQEEGFRADLYYRLSCVTIHIPPLRERRDDIPRIAEHLAAQCAGRNGIAVPRIEPKAVDVLTSHAWPGNVRELRNVIESSTVLASDGVLTAPRLKKAIGAAAAAPPCGAPGTLAGMERAAIHDALMACAWNQRSAARRLGIAPTSLFDKIRRFRLQRPEQGK